MQQSVRGPNPIDIHVGSRVRMRRTLLGMTQTGLGDAIGLTFQQVQKYERGLNRIGSSRLYDLARVLDVAVSFFFDDMPESVANKSPALVRGLAQGTSQAMEEFDPQLVSKRETLELVRAYYKISDTRVRRRLLDMIRALAANSEN